jgi:hypothetical protein
MSIHLGPHSYAAEDRLYKDCVIAPHRLQLEVAEELCYWPRKKVL